MAHLADTTIKVKVDPVPLTNEQLQDAIGHAFRQWVRLYICWYKLGWDCQQERDDIWKRYQALADEQVRLATGGAK